MSVCGILNCTHCTWLLTTPHRTPLPSDWVHCNHTAWGHQRSSLDQIHRWWHESSQQEDHFKRSDRAEMEASTRWLHGEGRGANTHYEAQEKRCCREIFEAHRGTICRGWALNWRYYGAYPVVYLARRGPLYAARSDLIRFNTIDSPRIT